jgi:hypothetical protein
MFSLQYLEIFPTRVILFDTEYFFDSMANFQSGTDGAKLLKV